MSSEFLNDVEGQRLVLDRAMSKPPRLLYTITLMSAVGGFTFGYDTGIILGAMPFLREYFELSYIWEEFVISIPIGTAWAFSLVAGVLADLFGRKPVIIMSSFVFTVGAVLMGTSVDKEMILGGRLLAGAALGFTSMIVPLYLSEVAPFDIRGKLVTLSGCFFAGGEFMAALIDGTFARDKMNGWRFMLGLAAVPSFIQFFGFLRMPESPRWLVARGKYHEALEVLKRIRGHAVQAEKEFESIKSNCLETEREMEAKGSSPIFVHIYQSPAVKRALIVGCLLQLTQQIVGINTVMYYSSSIIQMTGVRSESSVVWLATVTTSVIFFSSFLGLFLVEKIGRRSLTLFSLAGVAVSLGILAVGFQLANTYSPLTQINSTEGPNSVCSSYSSCSQCVNNPRCGYCFLELPVGPSNGSCLFSDQINPDVSDTGQCNNSVLEVPFTWAYEWCPSDNSWLILSGLILYLLCFASGIGSTPWTVNSEIYPFWARSTCCATAASVNWLSNLVVSLTFVTFVEFLNKYGLFWLYMSFAILGWIYFLLMLPETRGKPLEEVDGLFSHPWWQDATTADEPKTVQYVHIRGINLATNVDDPDSGDES
ncbi:proton myo-inositol cotransporter-like [Tachypleus tridentatus]|uniref:proton myo-inositol cotransporter-like n=1 Tax=Tachypleus tridentatus TaxID=6853 RepID=UPI003FD02447